MDVMIGTSGYDFDSWVGTFYPEELPAADRLGFYAREFRTVEINNTFYRNPRSAVVAGWRSAVPSTFQFALKASRRITHRDPLTDVETLGYLWRAAAGLDETRGPILFQTSPYFRRDVPRLQAFLAGLPEGLVPVMEFRNVSWRHEEVYQCLRDANAILCCSDTGRGAPPELTATTDQGYLRLHRPQYGVAALKEWAARIRDQDWESVSVFFKHDMDGAGPELAHRFADCLS